ncbi:MAG TPA: hypothetical protein PL112_17575 [Candidatus Obscuribacter sp.]|jgi:hypothetical protein|nr:hypothetical protein [Candidatus Obscuribacter sp.]HND06000.1 hypothetical protein [Candidatus Obscuribacter sp.]HND68618.1 hypothetical protein [Candidatus Obscuribacter sp.]
MIVVRHSYISARDRQSRRVPGVQPKVAAVGRALAHLKYIKHRPGEDREEGGRDMFDDREDDLNARAIRKAIRENQDSKVVVHKVTLAPEIDPEDQKAFTREVMKKLGRDKGLDLRWFGVEHRNTAHHHIHVVVMGKDKTGKDVRFDKKDYDRIKEYGDRYLERMHPFELERSRSDREERERQRIETRNRQREDARQERIRDGLELPWMHKKIIREQLLPYDEWKRLEKDRERGKIPPEEKAKRSRTEPEKESPYFNDTIDAAGKEWSKKNTLSELQELNQYLWDNQGERIDKPEYKKLVVWMKEKEAAARAPRAAESKENKERQEAQEASPAKEKERDFIEYQGKKYKKESSYEELKGLSDKLRNKKAERLPVDDYQKLRSWMENADRARWSGVLEKQIELSKKQYGREGAQKTAPQRVVNPLQEQVMANPVVGLFMQGAGVVNTLVSWVPLTDQRDRVKEAGDAMEEAKRDRHDQYVKPGRDPEARSKDQEAIDKLDKAIEENKRAQDKQKKKKKEKEEKRDKDGPFSRDHWGRW